VGVSDESGICHILRRSTHPMIPALLPTFPRRALTSVMSGGPFKVLCKAPWPPQVTDITPTRCHAGGLLPNVTGISVATPDANSLTNRVRCKCPLKPLSSGPILTTMPWHCPSGKHTCGGHEVPYLVLVSSDTNELQVEFP
jgi:hypothetical protein